MPGIKAYMSIPTQQKCIEWIASRGESYEEYIKFCDYMKISVDHRFTRDSWRVWVQRRRKRLQREREVQRAALREYVDMGRQQRIRVLEQTLVRLEGRIKAEEMKLPLRDYIALEEQKRRTLESIAKELGEFNREPVGRPASNDRASQAIAALEAYVSEKDRQENAVDVTPDGEDPV